jgi:hypothetical protein
MPEGLYKYALVEVLLKDDTKQVGHKARDAENWYWNLSNANAITYYRVVK